MLEANEGIVKSVPTYPDAWDQMYKVAQYKYKFSADGLKQYWSIPLDEHYTSGTKFFVLILYYFFTNSLLKDVLGS